MSRRQVAVQLGVDGPVAVENRRRRFGRKPSSRNAGSSASRCSVGSAAPCAVQSARLRAAFTMLHSKRAAPEGAPQRVATATIASGMPQVVTTQAATSR
jgi:hypothetical protein